MDLANSPLGSEAHRSLTLAPSPRPAVTPSVCTRSILEPCGPRRGSGKLNSTCTACPCWRQSPCVLPPSTPLVQCLHHLLPSILKIGLPRLQARKEITPTGPDFPVWTYGSCGLKGEGRKVSGEGRDSREKRWQKAVWGEESWPSSPAESVPVRWCYRRCRDFP